MSQKPESPTPPPETPRPAVSSRAAALSRLEEKLAPEHIHHVDGTKQQEVGLYLLNGLISYIDKWHEGSPFGEPSAEDTCPTIAIPIDDLIKRHGEPLCDVAIDQLSKILCTIHPQLHVETQLVEIENTLTKHTQYLVSMRFPSCESPDEARYLVASKFHETSRELRGICHGAEHSSCRAH